MLQVDIAPRQGWETRLLELGFDFYEVSSRHPYWCESQYVQMTRDQVDTIDAATEELHQLAIQAVEYVFDNDLLDLFGLPRRHYDLLRQSWATDKSYLYGRFDFAWDGRGCPKMLEYNAQTPTSLFEASVVAWDWMTQNVDSGKLPRHADQFNLLDERLIAQFAYLRETKARRSFVLHFACDEASSEDRRTVTYLAECAKDVGFETVIVDINAIQLTVDQRFADHKGQPIDNLFSLYPYEFALLDEYGDYIANSGCQFIEPLWKVLLSSKALLPILWQLNPGHKNLLECYFSHDPQAQRMSQKVIKPIYSREGANIQIVLNGQCVEGTSGLYGNEGFVTQEYAPLVQFKHGHCVIGSWMIGKTASGLSVRESNQRITNDVARFVPHIFLP
ncbi:glutathionylspermidine synthase family protein [Vibrio ostreicida]|uniref:Glutathionylspermidine synthase family protein n=1 Tax=Vibrio ostreicida TaxID=526588 RepID=A0ABT8BSV8_9VIBR|nr:glutathionylspermidine synthase family protein [Vibrio ostreicida]MDN3610241.1 glutathionylspermidine synthase family protein [Vibrio ostreicida]NPD07742.1 glutathionylspermidine synthase family protein [Vibrio ostreicida]